MTQNDETQKPALQIFLDQTLAQLPPGLVQHSDPATVRQLLTLWEQKKTPTAAAEYFERAHAAREFADFDAQLADARDALRSHAYTAEQEVRQISERITESLYESGPVDGVLNVALSAQDLSHLGGVLRVYQDYVALLDILYASLGSAQMALGVAKEDALNRIVNMRGADPRTKDSGALGALKRVIKILTNTL